MKNIVEAKWLNENIGRENLLILDARSELGNAEYGLKSYKEGHIEGAVYVSVEDILTGEIKEHGGRHPLPDLREFAKNINELGVDDEVDVVVYDDGDLSNAGRLWWMLKLIGKDNVKILGGGIKRWKAEGYPTSKSDKDIKQGNSLTFKLKEELESDVEEVRNAIKEDKTVIIDSRTAERFRGEVEPIDRVAGHIPSALNYPWTKLTEGSRVPDIKELDSYFAPLKKFDKIIVHCGSGISACINIIFMEEVGLEPKLYVGSWSDWITYKDNEIAVGE